jgi:hypothetical protein
VTSGASEILPQFIVPEKAPSQTCVDRVATCSLPVGAAVGATPFRRHCRQPTRSSPQLLCRRNPVSPTLPSTPAHRADHCNYHGGATPFRRRCRQRPPARFFAAGQERWNSEVRRRKRERGASAITAARRRPSGYMQMNEARAIYGENSSAPSSSRCVTSASMRPRQFTGENSDNTATTTTDDAALQ